MRLHRLTIHQHLQNHGLGEKITGLYRSLRSGITMGALPLRILFAAFHLPLGFLRRHPSAHAKVHALCHKPGFRVLLRLYRAGRMKQAAASWGGEPVLFPVDYDTAPPVWLSANEKLSTDKLIDRIQGEILAMKAQDNES